MQNARPAWMDIVSELGAELAKVVVTETMRKRAPAPNPSNNLSYPTPVNQPTPTPVNGAYSPPMGCAWCNVAKNLAGAKVYLDRATRYESKLFVDGGANPIIRDRYTGFLNYYLQLARSILTETRSTMTVSGSALSDLGSRVGLVINDLANPNKPEALDDAVSAIERLIDLALDGAEGPADYVPTPTATQVPVTEVVHDGPSGGTPLDTFLGGAGGVPILDPPPPL